MSKKNKKVVCLNTKEIFNSIKEACLFYYIASESSISLCCRGKRKYTGNLKDGTPLVWRYYEDYLKLSDDDINNIILDSIKKKKKITGKKVVCLNTKEVFNSAKEVKLRYNIAPSSLSNNCNQITQYSRKTIDGKPLVFRFYSDYINLNDKDIDNIFQNIKTRERKVKCLTTGKIYNSMTEASKKLNVSLDIIYKSCNGMTSRNSDYKWAYYS